MENPKSNIPKQPIRIVSEEQRKAEHANAVEIHNESVEKVSEIRDIENVPQCP